MAKKISYRPVEPIELEFADGISKYILFNSVSVSILEEEFEGLIKVLMDLKDKFLISASKIIYAGMKAYEEETTYEEVKSLIVQLPFYVINELLEEFTLSSVKVKNDGKNGTNQEVLINFLKEALQLK